MRLSLEKKAELSMDYLKQCLEYIEAVETGIDKSGHNVSDTVYGNTEETSLVWEDVMGFVEDNG